jgi:hypothetical protein
MRATNGAGLAIARDKVCVYRICSILCVRERARVSEGGRGMFHTQRNMHTHTHTQDEHTPHSLSLYLSLSHSLSLSRSLSLKNIGRGERARSVLRACGGQGCVGVGRRAEKGAHKGKKFSKVVIVEFIQ